MMDYNTLVALLKELAADMTSSDGCVGCGHEHNCQTEGCAILRDAVATMEQLHKDCSGMCRCCIYRDVNPTSSPCLRCPNRWRIDHRPRTKWRWRGVQEKNGGQSDE